MGGAGLEPATSCAGGGGRARAAGDERVGSGLTLP